MTQVRVDTAPIFDAIRTLNVLIPSANTFARSVRIKLPTKPQEAEV